MGSRKIALCVLVAALAVSVLMLPPVAAQQVHRNGFESRVPSWVRGATDAQYKEMAHDISERTSHSGQFSEHIQIDAGQGTYSQYVYVLGKAPIVDELNIAVWVKANRPGIQLQARVVLPHEKGATLDDRLTTVLRGDTYQLAGRWQRLELRRAAKLTKEQQPLMRAELKRDINFGDAYIDRLILNVHAGLGMTELWIDDLEVSPVVESNTPAPPPPSATSPGSVPTVPVPRTPMRSAVVELNQDRLLVGGKPFYFLGIRHSDTPLKVLRDAGFNTVWFDYAATPQKLEEAVKEGFWLVPSLPVTSGDPRLVSQGGVGTEVARLAFPDAVLWYDLGGGLAEEQKDLISRSARYVKMADTQKPVGADVWDGFRPYSRCLDLVGVHRWPLLTSLELTQYRDWLNQRRQLARPGTFFWTWVQTHLPEWYTSLVYEQSSAAPFREPIGPQPEQIRLMTYVALSAGCRGLGFWSDRFLADTHQGRDRLLTLALLNQEIRMLGPMILTAGEPTWVAAENSPDVKAAVFRCERGSLVLPMWLGRGGQFVPGQAAQAKVKVIVPEVAAGSSAWLVSPAEVRSLAMERVAGGTRITIPEFGLTAAVVFTNDLSGDNSLLDYFQTQCRRMRKLAAQWAHDLAQVEIEKVARVEEELEAAGHTLPDGKELMENARTRMRNCEQFWESGEYTLAYAEAERAMRPLRIMMRAQWEQALRDLDVPVASPYAVSFYTLPRHWRFMQQIKQTSPGSNVVPGGDFEELDGRPATNWTSQEANLDNVEMVARRVPVPAPIQAPVNPAPRHGSATTSLTKLAADERKIQPKEPPAELGKQCLELSIKAKSMLSPDGKPAPTPVALERTFLAINSPAVQLPPGTLVRISGWVQVSEGAVTASADGALLYDSAGGEALGLRVTQKMAWRKFTFYRRVPASGSIYVTMALTGFGKVYFDNIHIEPLYPTAATVARPR
jgi:hypothetical protein